MTSCFMKADFIPEYEPIVYPVSRPTLKRSWFISSCLPSQLRSFAPFSIWNLRGAEPKVVICKGSVNEQSLFASSKKRRLPCYLPFYWVESAPKTNPYYTRGTALFAVSTALHLRPRRPTPDDDGWMYKTVQSLFSLMCTGRLPAFFLGIFVH